MWQKASGPQLHTSSKRMGQVLNSCEKKNRLRLYSNLVISNLHVAQISVHSCLKDHI